MQDEQLHKVQILLGTYKAHQTVSFIGRIEESPPQQIGSRKLKANVLSEGCVS